MVSRLLYFSIVWIQKQMRFVLLSGFVYHRQPFLFNELKRTLYSDENSDKKSLYLSREGHLTVYIMLKNAAPAISRGLVLCEVYADVWMATL